MAESGFIPDIRNTVFNPMGTNLTYDLQLMVYQQRKIPKNNLTISCQIN